MGFGNRSKLGRQGENYVKAADRQHACRLLLDPLGLRQSLTLWAVAIAAGVVGWSLLSTGGALVEMAAQCGSTAAHNVAYRSVLLRTETMVCSVYVGLCTQDVGDLKAGPLCGATRAPLGCSHLSAEHTPGWGAEQVDWTWFGRQPGSAKFRVVAGAVDGPVSQQDLYRSNIGSGVK